MEINLDNECKQNAEEKTVVDERCYCGHLKSEHNETKWECWECPCKRFAWYGWVFSDGSET